jgi:hypothetical protein
MQKFLGQPAAGSGGWVMDSTGAWIHPDSATSTVIDINSTTGVTTITITQENVTWIQTITPSNPSGTTSRNTITEWVRQ